MHNKLYSFKETLASMSNNDQKHTFETLKTEIMMGMEKVPILLRSLA